MVVARAERKWMPGTAGSTQRIMVERRRCAAVEAIGRARIARVGSVTVFICIVMLPV